MSEVIDAPVTEQPAAVVEEQTTEQPQSSESAPETQEQETTKPPETEEQKRSKYQRRIDRKNSEIAAARTEARLLRERLEQLEARNQAPREPGAPKLEQFDNFEDYVDAVADYKASKAVESRMSAAQQEAAQRKAQERSLQVQATWQDRQEAAKEKYADFEEVVGESDATISPEMGQAIVESDLGPDIAYYLAKNPKEAKQIAEMSPIRQISAIGRLEAKLSQPAPKKATDAPAPIVPAGSKAKAEKDPVDMSPSEFAAWRKKFRSR